MTRRIIILSVLLLQALAVNAQPDPVKLWEGVSKGPHTKDVELYAFPAPDSIRSDVAVIVCPGGSYYWLDRKGEGFEVAQWLQKQGINAFVLFYRVAGVDSFILHHRFVIPGVKHPDMITDAQYALLWVRRHAGEYGVSKDKVGMVGFSAGGHLVLSAACFSSTDFLALSGITADESLRPDFVASIYPVVTMHGSAAHGRSRRALLGDGHRSNRLLQDSLSIEKHIPSSCPPVFVVNCKDDPVVDYHNSEILDAALTAAGASHKYIQYEKGKHGFGVSEVYGTPESRRWKFEFIDWLKEINILQYEQRH